jgi:hypothetical protein
LDGDAVRLGDALRHVRSLSVIRMPKRVKSVKFP